MDDVETNMNKQITTWQSMFSARRPAGDAAPTVTSEPRVTASGVEGVAAACRISWVSQDKGSFWSTERDMDLIQNVNKHIIVREQNFFK